MRTCAITAIRNECDIIEAFVRANSQFLDLFYFIDDSTDHTPLILSKLKDEGFPIELVNSNFATYRQDVATTSAIRKLARLNLYDWFIVLDADEFLTWKSRREFEASLSLVPSNLVAAVEWSTFIPQHLDYFQFSNPLVDNFRPRVPESSSFKKLFVPSALAQKIQISVGNHSASLDDGLPIDEFLLSNVLAHVPVRSGPQVIMKAILATHALQMRTDRQPGEGFHIVQILDLLRERNFEIDLPLLQRVGFGYAVADLSHIPNSIDPNVIIGGEHTRLRYSRLSRLNVLSALDARIARLSECILALNKANLKLADDL